MAARNLCRRLAPITELSTPKLVGSCLKSESLVESATNSAIRFVSSSARQPQPEQANLSEERRGEHVKEKLTNDDQKDQNDDAEDEVDEYGVNKVTGEVGGPRGPEPTRYGDWERNGRCSDF